MPYLDPWYERFCRGQSLAAMGKYEEAIEDYDWLIGNLEMRIRPLPGHSLPPRRLPLGERLCRGEACMALQRWEAAAGDFTNVIESFKRSSSAVCANQLLVSAYKERAQVYQAQGKHDLAAQDRANAKKYGPPELAN